MSLIKTIFLKPEISDYQYIEKIMEIENRNLQIEFSKFHQSIAKSNEKMKKTIFLRYIYYYLKHLELSNKEQEILSLSSDLKEYVKLKIVNMRAEQILKLVNTNLGVNGQNIIILDNENDELISSDELSNEIIEKLTYIQLAIEKKYRYNELEKQELENINSMIEEQKQKFEGQKEIVK